jgi:hypothetical protein
MPLQFDDHETAYRWSRREDARAIGGSYRWEHRAGGSAAFVFQGSAVTVYTIDGQAMGRARLRIDGRVVATVDGFSRSLRRREHRFAGLGAGEHRLTVTVLGTRRPSSKGTRVAVDALRTRAGFEADPVPVSATWARDRDPAASGGSYAIADAPGAEGRLLFAGTGVELRARRGPDAGKLQIHVDGRYIRTVDLYAERGAFASIAIARGLDDSPHVVRLVVLGTHRRVSGGSEVAIDRWTVDRAIPA